MKYNVLVLGSGGREHALCWKLAQSPLMGDLHCIPGNAGIQEIAQIHSQPDILDFPSLENFCKGHSIHLIVVGKEQPLVNGIKDFFADTTVLVFGPSKHASTLEGSKIYTKNLLAKYNIPTASYETFFNKDDAIYHLESIQQYPIVIKADGLAQGKGVDIVYNKEEALASILDMMEHKKFKQAGEKILIEDFLEGQELSYQVIVNQDQYFDCLPTQDYKKAYNENRGPNTGGMGSVAPATWVTDDILHNIRHQVVKPLMKALQKENNPYSGVMFIGLIVNKNNQPTVLEINVRFGDPESQVLLPLLESDLLPLMIEIAQNKKIAESYRLEWKKNTSATCIVLSSKGYPENYQTGFPIHGLDTLKETKDCICFHAGTKNKDQETVTAGGRVLNIVGLGTSLQESTKKAYEFADFIEFEGKTHRSDIGQ
jgi:phosphoribosylamine--glycine ligase